jgi:uncharacterized short protein YbdD (DUF466 family)
MSEQTFLARSTSGTNALWRTLRLGWRFVRQVSGDDAYERYVRHMAQEHPGQAPTTRARYFAAMQEQKWSRVSRCC